MSIAVLFTPPAMDETQYRQIVRRLEATGLAAPHGREYHVCFGSGDQLRVLDVWESAEALEAFANTLRPIVLEAGSDPDEPDVQPLVNSIEGTHGSGDTQERNKAVVRRFLEGAFAGHDLELLEELVAPDYVDLDPELRDRNGLRAFWEAVFAGFPDVGARVESQIAEGDMVVTRWVSEGTHKADFMGIPATGKWVSVRGVEVDRVVNGRIVEQQNVWDKANLMRQLGALPAVEPAHV